MTSILYWNIAGGGSNRSEDIADTLSLLAARSSKQLNVTPDFIVISESCKITKQNKDELAGGSYTYIKPCRTIINDPDLIKNAVKKSSSKPEHYKNAFETTDKQIIKKSNLDNLYYTNSYR